MSLEGAKLICLDEAGNHGEMVLAKGRKFTMGYYVSSDYVLVDERAKGVHCVIECDAFGRVTIRNLSPDKPILVNGSTVEIKRILLNNSKLSILDKDFLWQFPKSFSNEFEDLPTGDASTPQKQVGIPEQPANSCPDFKLHRELPKRFTIHNFAYCIQSDEEGNMSSDSNDETTKKAIHTTQTNQSENENENQTNQDKTKDSNKNTTDNADTETKTTQKRSITPEPNNELDNASTDLLETPKMNLINCTKDKENKSTENKHKTVLTMCHQSDVVITSFSPRETGVKVERSFATIVKPKVLVTKPPTTTPKSVYSTPKSDMNDRDVDDENESEVISFYTPSTSKKATVINTAFAKVHKNSSMHLIDLTTPNKLRPASPYLKSALKASATKNITETVNKYHIKLPLEGQLGLSILPLTPVLAEASNSPLQTPSSVISVSSSIDTSSIIEVTSDGSNIGATPSNATGPTTPLKSHARTGAYTPKRTPQSLMKRAILTSAKKQTTPQSNTQIPTTPRRESINRIPLRSNIALLRTPITPQASTGNKSTSELPKRHSMSTPTRKIISTRRTSNITSVSPLTSSKLLSRPSSPNPISAANALPTSTPVSIPSNNSALKARAACKTSPLYKVRKSIGGVPLSTHISKTRRSLLIPASTSKITSIKKKSPQQVISERLVSRARKSVCVTPISARSRNMVTAAKTPPQAIPSSILKDKKTQSVKKPERKAVLFTDKPPQKSGEVDDLSRTFIVDSDEEENVASKKQKEKPNDATFSPEKDLNESKKLDKKLDTKVKAEDHTTIEIPVDVEEIKEIDKSSQKKNIILEKNNQITCTEFQESESLTEESFAEIINDSQEQINLGNTIEISDSPKESLQNKSHKMMADAVDAVVLEENTNDLVKILTQNDNEQTEIVETGFGEESFEEVSLTPKENVIQDENAASDQDNLKKTEHENKTELQDSGESKNVQSDEQKVQTHVQEFEAELTEKLVKEAESTYEETKSVATRNDEDKIELKVVDPKSEYKPIVEDITLEGSLIEKEIKEIGETNVSKQPLCEDITLEGSLIEKKVKTEEFEEEKEIKEATIINLLSNSAKEFHQIEKTEHNIIEDESNISQVREITPTTPEHEISKVDNTIRIEQLKTNQNELELLDIHQLREVDGEKISESPNIIKELQVSQTESLETFQTVEETSEENVEKATESIEKLEISHATQFNIIQVNEVTFNENLEKTVYKSDTAQDQQASKSETKSSTIVENKIDDLENTNKLLEEIEDVLNKSDEIKQKHISELGECGQLSEKPLTEEFETEKLSQETNHIVQEVTSSSNGNKNTEFKSVNIVKKLEESMITNKKVLKISDKSTPLQEIKNDTTSQEQEISSTECIVTDTETSASKSEIEPSKNEIENAQYEEQEYKSSEDTFHLTENYTSIEVKTYSVAQEESKVEENEEEHLVDNIVFQSEDKPKESEIVIQNKENLKELKVIATENIVSESDGIFSIEENPKLIIQREPLPQESERIVSSEDTVHLTENYTSIEKKSEPAAREEPKVKENEDEQLEENVVFQSEDKPKESEIIQNKENLQGLEVIATENIVSESDGIFSIEENPKLIIQREPLPQESERIVSSEDTVHLTENYTSIEKKSEPAAREEPKVKENEDEQLEENVVFQSEDKPKESEIIQNKENLQGLEVIATENIVSESDGIFSIENPKLLIQREPLPKETERIVPSEDTVHLTEDYTSIEEKCESAAQEESKGEENEEEQLVEDIIFQSEDKPKESEIVIQNKENLKELEVVARENIDSESELVIQKEPEPTETESIVSSEIITEEFESQKPNPQENGSIVVNPNTFTDVEGDISTRIKNKEDISPNEETTALNSKETPAKPEIKSKENDANLDERSAVVKYLCQNLESKFFENNSESTDIKTVRLPLQNDHSSNLEDESKELSFIKKNIENATIFTPRRSSRRASQSTETPQIITEQTNTPRRSARRASISAETTSTSTPTKRTTRRASLSAVSETLLTPKHITKRRSSITVEDDTFLPSTSKTPRKQLEHRTVILEENKVVDAVIIEEEEEVAEENVQLEENKRRTTVIPEEMDNIVGVILEEEELESVQHKTKNNEEKLEIGEILEKYSTTPTELPKKPTKAVVEPIILETRDAIEKHLSVTQENPENLEIDSTSDESKVYTADTLEMKVYTQTLIPKEKLATKKIDERNADVEENIEVKTKTAISKNNFDEKENIVESIKKQDVNKDNLEKLMTDEVDKMLPKEVEITEDNTTFVKLVETPELKEISETSIASDVENIKDTTKNFSKAAHPAKTPTKENANISSDMEVYTPTTKKSVQILADSPKTPLMSGMRELLKTPKAEAQTPRLRGIRDLLRTPKEKLENEYEEMEKLSMVAELISTPKPEVDISTPKSSKLVKFVADSPKTPEITDMQELLKTPKAEIQTSQLGGKLDLKRTPREKLGNIVDNLVIIPKARNEISTSNAKKQVRLVVDTPKTPVLTGMRELLKTPKAEMDTPKLVGIRNLVQTPKTQLENDQDEIEKLAVVSELIKTPQVSKLTENIIEELSSSSVNNENLKGIKELLKTPKSCSTPRFKGMRELMQTPKMCSTPVMSGIKELLESTAPELEKEPTVEIADNSETLTVEEIPSSTSKNMVNLQGVNELLKTPKGFGTPNLRGIRELMQTPKISSTPLTAGIKELMDPQTQQKDQELEKFLRTPTAKNLMIPSMPSSAVIEKSSDSIEISTEYDLNATNEQGTVNLEELFKTPVASRFVERITSSYYSEEGCEHIETVNRFTKNITLQETLNKSAEEAYDKLVGQETQIHTPIRKIYQRKSFNLQTPQVLSPFTAADVLSDLPKSDVEEWIETLNEAEPPPILELANVLEESQEEIVKQDIPNESLKENEDVFRLEYSLNEKDEQNISSNESIIPETCTKVYLTEKTFATASLTKTDTTDPLSNTSTKPKETDFRPATPMDAEISGIDLLDQTIESAHDEPSMLDDPLVVEEPSMFEQPLLVSDNESEADNTLNNIESQDEANDLSEPLLFSDSEDLNQSQELETKENAVKDLQTTNLNITAQEKSLLENVSNAIDYTAEEPLDKKVKEPETLAIVLEMENKTEMDDSQQKEEYKEKETSNDISMTESTEFLDKNETSEVISSEIIELSEALEISISCPIEEVSIDQTEKELSENPEIPLTNENLDAEIDAAETNVIEENDGQKTRNQNIDAKEISIEQTEVVSEDSEIIFLDTSVTEIFEETNISNEEQVDQKENKDIKKTFLNSNKTNQEYEDIFMDNSNIDESFADEAFNENEENDVENESAIVKVTRKEVSKNETKSVAISADSDNKDNTSANIITVCEIDECNEEEKSVTENMVINEEKNASQKEMNPDEEEFDLLIVAEETTKKDEAKTSVKYSLEDQNEPTKLQSQIEAQSSKISEIKLNSLEETTCESDNSLVKLHSLEKKEGGTLDIQLGSLNETIVHITNDEISKEQQKKAKESTEIIDQFKSSTSAASSQTDAKFKEKIHHYSDPNEILTKNIKTSNVSKNFDISQSANQNSEVSDVQADKDFEFKKSGSLISDQMGQLEKGACLLNKSAITEESSLESTEHLEQYSLVITTKNVFIKEMSSTRTEDVDESSSTKKEENKFNNEESSKTINNIAEDLDNPKASEYSEEKESSSQDNTFNTSKETPDKTKKVENKIPTNLEVKSKIDVIVQKCTSPTEELSFDIHKDTKTTSAAEKVGSEDYKQDKNLKESSVKEIGKNLTEEVAVKSLDILKTYDFEIKINDTDHIKGTETESSAAKSEIPATNLRKRNNSQSIETFHLDLELRASRQNNKNTKTEETTFESETQHTKSFIAEKMQNSQAEKSERLENVIVLKETEEISKDTEQNILENLTEEVKENEPKMHSVKIRKNRTMSESSQDSIHDDKPSSSSRRDRRKVIKKPIENKLEEVKEEKFNQQQTLKELTFELVKEGENPKRKRSASESSQESVKKDDNSTSTRRGGRRKLLKPPTEETVIEQKLEDEEIESEQILKEITNPEKDKKPITLTEEKELTNIVKSFYDAEKSKNIIEKVNEFPMEKQEHMGRGVAESADSKQHLTKGHKQATISTRSDKYDTQQSIEKHRDESKEHSKSSLLVEDLNVSKEGIIEVLVENMVLEHNEKVAAEIILSDETSTLAINKEQISDTSEENVFKSLNSPENITTKPLEIVEENKKSDEVVVSEDTLLATLNEYQKENIITETQKETCNENKVSVRKCIRSNETISEPSESSVLAKDINTFITASPGDSVDVPVKALITTDTEIKDKSEEDIETAQESLPEVEVVDITEEDLKEQLVRRGRRNPTMSESSQGSVKEDHNTRARKTRQKVQQTPVEEIIVEGDLLKEEVAVAATSTEILSETKLFGVIEHKSLAELADNEIVQTQSITLEEVKEQTIKHGLRKAVVSDSSGRSKVQKSPGKTALEFNEEQKTSEMEIATETEEDKHEIIFKDVSSESSKADLDVVESKQSPHSVKLTSKVSQTFKKVILEDQTSETQIDDDKSKKIIGKRGRHKHDLSETVIEEPTTSRKGRRKVHPLTGKVSPKEVSANYLETESDIKTPQEIVGAHVVAQIITVKEDQTVQGIVLSNVEKAKLLESSVELKEQQQDGDTVPESKYVSTLHKTRRGGRQKVKDVEELPRESAETEETAKVDRKTAVKQIAKRGRHLRHDIKEVSVENAGKVEETILESDEESPTKVDHTTKQTVKRGRQRKHEVDEVPVEKAVNPEDKIPESDATRHGARHKTAVLKGRAARNRKTPFEDTTAYNQQELAKIINDIPTSIEAIQAEDSKVRTSSRNCKSIVEQQTVCPKPEEQTVARTLSRNRKSPVETIVNEESMETLKQTDKIPRNDDKTESQNIDILHDCKDQELTQAAAEFNKEKDDNDVKKRAKRTLPASESSKVSVDDEKPDKKHQMAEIEESHEEVFKTNAILPQNQESSKNNLEEIIQSHDGKVKLNKAIEEKSQKSTRRIATAKHDEHDKHDEATSTKSQKRRAAHDKNKQHVNTENVKEPHGKTLLSEVKVTEVNLEPEEMLDQQTSQEEEEVSKEVIVKKSRRKIAANKHLEDYETLPVTKRRAVIKNIERGNDESAPSTKRRRKQAGEENNTEEEHVKHTVTSETTSRRQNFGRSKLEPEQKDNNINEEKHDAEEETKHAESSETTIRRHNIGRKKHEDNDKPKPEEMRAHIESSDDKTNKLRNVGIIQHDRNQDDKDDNVSSEQKQEEIKKGRGRRQKSDHQEETEQLKTSLHSPETKQRGRKRKELHTDTCDPVPKGDCSEEKITKDPQPNVNIPSAHIEHHTPQRATSIARRGRKASAIEHITAESQELDDTPGRRARNVPQRRAATAYHNYDETSDSEVSTKTKKKIDSPRKSLEAVEKLDTATVTTATVINLSPLPSSTTARGRTRKPTAKVQQLLEEERAKAESPKKRGLLAAAATAATADTGTLQHTPARRGRKVSTIETVVTGTSQATAAGCGDTGTPQRTPARRGRKASTIETVVAGTPQAVRGRGRGKPAVVHTKEEPSAAVVEDKEAELHTTPANPNHIKGRRGGRKAKITEEDHQTGDEPSAKKSPLELESEKQDASTSVEPPTPPTREAGRRNAAAAAKARIEEDALAAASIDPPKRSRAKKVLTKVATPDAPSSEMEEDQAAISKKPVKNKNSPQKREHRLASATTVEGDEDVENDIETETSDKPTNKRGRKKATEITSDSPAVPVKKRRKAKTIEEVANTDIPEESKTTRGRGRGRKNVHFDEHEEAESTTSTQQKTNNNETATTVEITEPVKKATRSRRK